MESRALFKSHEVIVKIAHILKTVLYPILLLFEMPYAWYKSLNASKILLDGKWSNYMGFHPKSALNALFYRTQWINLDKYGKSGLSTIMGLGNTPVARLFHLSLPASYIYAHAGTTVTLICSLVWSFSHVLWMQERNELWVLLAAIIVTLSSTTYSMAFVRQNYQIIGWMWLPSALFFTMNQNWVAAGIIWLLASFSGYTHVYYALLISLAISVLTRDIAPIIVLIPALFKSATHLHVFFQNNRISQIFHNTTKLIGLTSHKVRYKRWGGGQKNALASNAYIAGVYFISCVLLWAISGRVPYLAWFGLFLFVLNQRFVRVADIQSMNIIFVSLLFADTAYNAAFIATIPVIWFSTVLHPYSIGISRNLSGNVQIFKPFDHTPIESQISHFLAPVPKHSRILFAFDDPKGLYGSLYNGYRVLIELPIYIASLREIHLMPDWYAVADTNFEGAPQIWGRTPDQILANLTYWQASYAIIYDNADKTLDSSWYSHFDVLSTFSWQYHADMLREHAIIEPENFIPVWYLLKVRST